MIKRKLFILNLMICGLIMSACNKVDKETPPRSPQVLEGQALVAENCIVCHSVNSSESSPRDGAPTLDRVLENYNSESLADDFREGIHVGHPDMPDFDFGAKGTDEIVAYLISIQRAK